MTHDELLAKINYNWGKGASEPNSLALRAVVKLHKPKPNYISTDLMCDECRTDYPCQTIQGIEKELA